MNFIKQHPTQFVLAVLVAVAMFSYLQWLDGHDKAVAASADAYAKCVQAQYGVNPSAWYDQHGSYPECH